MSLVRSNPRNPRPGRFRPRRPRYAIVSALLASLMSTVPATASERPDGPAPGRAPLPVADGGRPPSHVVAIGDSLTAPLSLSECLAIARRDNPELAGERIRRGELTARATQAIAEALPTLDVVGSWNRSRDPSFALDATFGGGDSSSSVDSLFGSFLPEPADIPAQTFWRASLNATWEINPLRIYNAVRGAGIAIRRQDTAIVAAEHSAVEQVLQGYDAVRVAGEELLALDAELAAREEFLEISRRRFRLDMATALDTLQAAVSLANLEPERREAATRLADSGAHLNTLLGRDPGSALAVLRELEIESEALRREALHARVGDRPDLIGLRQTVRVLEKARGAQQALHRPYFSLAGSYGYVGRTFDSLTDDGHDFWSASVALTLPLFDGLLTRGQVKETEAVVARTRRELEDAERRARAEIDRLHGELLAARENFGAARLNTERADLVVREMTHRYELGKAEYLEVLNAQSERFRARAQEIAAGSLVFTRTAALKRALGYDPSLPLRALPEILAEEAR